MVRPALQGLNAWLKDRLHTYIRPLNEAWMVVCLCSRWKSVHSRTHQQYGLDGLFNSQVLGNAASVFLAISSSSPRNLWKLLVRFPTRQQPRCMSHRASATPKPYARSCGQAPQQLRSHACVPAVPPPFGSAGQQCHNQSNQDALVLRVAFRDQQSKGYQRLLGKP